MRSGEPRKVGSYEIWARRQGRDLESSHPIGLGKCRGCTESGYQRPTNRRSVLVQDNALDGASTNRGKASNKVFS
jgi:hypothetical protein